MIRPHRPLAQVLIRRLTLIAAVIVALNLVVVSLYYGSDRPALEAEVVAAVTERLSAALEGNTLPAAASARAIFADHPTAYAFALVDRTGVVVDAMNRHLIPPSAIDIFADDWVTAVDLPTGRLVYAGHEFRNRTDGLRVVFVMAADPENLVRRALLSELRQHVWGPILPMAILLIAASAILIRRELAPVARAAAWARSLRPDSLTPPPAGPVPSEVADLIDGTQRALDQLALALAAETRRAAEAAHALRTPVAVLTARLDALPPGETTEKLRADLAALSRTVQQVLAASRADVLTAPADAALDLRDPAKTVTAALAGIAYSKGIELALSIPDEPVTVRANREAVELALSNLIENAVLHGGPGEVEITVGPDRSLSVRDHGPGLPPGANTRVFQPFWRAPGAVAGGTGLGLAIVDRLQHAQGGTVTAKTPEDGGCEVILSFAPTKT
ncbi:HAMP domain-containing sensor histidine kinase [Phreatobacter sp.]|uniref:sensor histidine kinase n=1 Tax=Phreatobacter sp. TaxID=1966341 RepID=UPI0025CDDE0C|nr:HAMP domain-containing sensor histidine kinase [Phreatobacter sp.]